MTFFQIIYDNLQHTLNGPYPEFRYYILEVTRNIQHRNKWRRVYKNQVFVLDWK